MSNLRKLIASIDSMNEAAAVKPITKPIVEGSMLKALNMISGSVAPKVALAKEYKKFISEGIGQTIANKVMGRAPTNKYKAGQTVAYDMDPAQEGIGEEFEYPDSQIADPEERARIHDVKTLMGMFGNARSLRRARILHDKGMLKATPKEKALLLRMTDENGTIKPRTDPGLDEGIGDFVKGVKRKIAGKAHPEVVAAGHLGTAIGHCNQGDRKAGAKEEKRYIKTRDMHRSAKGIEESASQIEDVDVWAIQIAEIKKHIVNSPELFESSDNFKELSEFLKLHKTPQPTVGANYIYLSVLSVPVGSSISLAYFNSPHKLIKLENDKAVFNVNGASKQFPAETSFSGDMLQHIYTFESEAEFAHFKDLLLMKFSEWRISEKVLDAQLAAKRPTVRESFGVFALVNNKHAIKTFTLKEDAMAMCKRYNSLMSRNDKELYGHKYVVRNIAEGTLLNFSTLDLTESQIYSYIKKNYEVNGIERLPQKLASDVKNPRAIRESSESNIKGFINFVESTSIPSTDKISIGDKLAVLNFEINFGWKEITVTGFTVPKEITDIKVKSDGTINYVKFADGDRYPRVSPARYEGKPLIYAAYYIDNAAEALSAISLRVPTGWDYDHSELQHSMTEAMPPAVATAQTKMIAPSAPVTTPGVAPAPKAPGAPVGPAKVPVDPAAAKAKQAALQKNIQRLGVPGVNPAQTGVSMQKAADDMQLTPTDNANNAKIADNLAGVLQDPSAVQQLKTLTDKYNKKPGMQ